MILLIPIRHPYHKRHLKLIFSTFSGRNGFVATAYMVTIIKHFLTMVGVIGNNDPPSKRSEKRSQQPYHQQKQAGAMFYLFASRQYTIFNIISTIYIALIYYFFNLLLLSQNEKNRPYKTHLDTHIRPKPHIA